MKTERLTFINATGHQLAARLERPDEGIPRAYALFAHCFTGTKNLRAVSNIAQSLTEQGIAVFRFDFTGLGESEGDFSDTNFSSNVTDLVSAANFLEANYEAPKILVGHSLGGAAVLQAAHSIPSAIAVATIAAPYEPSHVLHLISDRQDEIENTGEALVKIGGRSFKIKKQFLDDLEDATMEETVSKLKRALIIFHSPIDNVVGIENARKMFFAARHPKSFITLDQADHMLTDPSDSQYVGTVIAAWAHKYVVASTGADASTAPEPVMVSADRSRYRTNITVNGHTLVADEPQELGGTDQGPTPYDLLLSSLGSCTAITLRMYADRKNWPLENIDISLTHSKVHAQDCEECETKTGQIDHIKREIDLTGSLDAEQRARLLEIADRCPVHRTLQQEIVVKTELTKN
ncbi:MAG: alpha/beta fold hydrolase [Candidatus Latescibacteria bacterium]|jgi:uncharacterized OsmC-like protein/alpha/beta superfamily hydrolase|nr:alpha/beta fold hydrolase [Candidatus Latescibacterota bacterium]